MIYPALSPKKKSRSRLELKRSRHPSTQSKIPKTKSPGKTRIRRASSLDRETKSKSLKSKNKQGFHSDNEIETESTVKGDDDAVWNNADESTDEEYFQNEFKNFPREGDEKLSPKKVPTAPTLVKKKKGYLFKQKYIFQRKRKANKGKGKTPRVDDSARVGGQLDEIYSFHEEVSLEFSTFIQSMHTDVLKHLVMLRVLNLTIIYAPMVAYS